MSAASSSLGVGIGVGSSSVSGDKERERTGDCTGDCIGDDADDGMVGISEGVLKLTSSASCTFSLHLQSAVWKSVETSDAHTSAVMYSVGAGVVHTGTVTNSVPTSDAHTGAVSYSVSQSRAVSYSDGIVERLLNDAVEGEVGDGAV